jgi:hypothetical protein
MNARLNRLVVAALGAAMLAGCGGARTLPAATAASIQGTDRVAGAILIRVPSTTSSAARRVHYVAATSRSAKIAIAAGPGCTQCSSPLTIEVSLTTSGVCAASAGAVTCTIPLSLLPGTYAASMGVYNGSLDPQGHVTGNALSENTSFPIPIVSGQANSVGVTLAGVPASIVETIFTPALLYTVTGVQNTTPYTIDRFVGTSANAQIAVHAKDSDGNIIAGPGAPTWTFGVTGAGYSAPTASGNTITLTGPAAMTKARGILTITANSPACANPAANCTRTEQLGMAQTLGIVDYTKNQPFGSVVVSTIGAAAALATVTTGISQPGEITFAPDGTLFAVNFVAQTVTAYKPPYTGIPIVISSTLAPTAAVTDAAGNLYVSNAGGGGSVTIYPPPYTTAPTGTIAAAPCYMLTFDAQGYLWCAYLAKASRYAPPFAGTTPVASVNLPNNAGISAIAITASGALYVADYQNSVVQRYDPPYTAAPTTIGSTLSLPLVKPNSVGFAPNGTVLVGSSSGLGVYKPNGNPIGQITGQVHTVQSIAFDDDGIAWIGNGTGSGPLGVPYPYDGTSIRPLTTNATAFGGSYSMALVP